MKLVKLEKGVRQYQYSEEGFYVTVRSFKNSRTTVAVKQDSLGNLLVASCCCSKNDTFSHRIGIVKACERMASEIYAVLPAGIDIFEIFS